MNDGALESGCQVCGGLGRFRVVPDGAFFQSWRAQHSIKIILSGAALEIDQLSHAEAPQGARASYDWP